MKKPIKKNKKNNIPYLNIKKKPTPTTSTIPSEPTTNK